MTSERAVDGWEELRRLAEAASPGPYVFNGYPFTLGGADAEFAIASANYVRSRLAAARGEPPEPGPAIDVERLREALTAMWPHHTEGIGSSPPSPGDHSYEVWEPFLPGSPDSVAAALVSALRDKP